MLLAVALGEARRHAEALEAFASAEQEFIKNKSDALDASFYLTYGAAAERAGLVEQAATLLKKSISLDPENAAEALNYLGFMWVDRDLNLEEAGTLIRKALGLRPNYPAYLDSLGWWYYRKGDLAGAARELRRALERIRREEAAEVMQNVIVVLWQSLRPRRTSRSGLSVWRDWRSSNSCKPANATATFSTMHWSTNSRTGPSFWSSNIWPSARRWRAACKSSLQCNGNWCCEPTPRAAP
jgi:tetratricopeptide (TPR) repeat protein